MESLFDNYGWILALLSAFFFVRWIWWMARQKYQWLVGKTYSNSLDRVLLEIVIPNQLEKTPHGMEQLFNALLVVKTSWNWWQKEILKFKDDEFSFELVSFGGEIHFCIYTIPWNRNMIESNLYAQFPDIEIYEVEDYIKNSPFPEEFPTDDWDFRAEEYIKMNPDYSPIKTYRDFDVQGGKDAFITVDPIAGLLEIMANIDADEEVWIQFVLRPASNDWQEEGKAYVNKIVKGEDEGEKKKLTGSKGFISLLISELFDWFVVMLKQILSIGDDQFKEEEKKKDDFFRGGLFYLPPGEQENIKAIERNIAESGWYTMIRFVYIAPQGKCDSSKMVRIMSTFESYGDQNMNGFTPNPHLNEFVKWFPRDIFNMVNFYMMLRYHLPFPLCYEQVKMLRGKEILRAYYKRKGGKKQRGHRGSVLTPPELATLYHFPMASVATPTLPRVDAKRGSPPAELPTRK